jgi:hypothetical protein
MFNNPQGLIPLSHEMLTAQRLSQEGSTLNLWKWLEMIDTILDVEVLTKPDSWCWLAQPRGHPS